MQRRDFLKISAITSATAALDSCGKPETQLIRFIPEEDLVPGIAIWKPGLCTHCPAGCGTLVRVMEGEAEVVREGRIGLMKMGLAKKLEGNPQHPISQGKLCPRGQAGLQVTYHPDRIRNPMKRSGPRGSGQFQEIGWDEAFRELTEQLRKLQSANQTATLGFLSKPLRGQRRVLVERFLSAYGAPPPVFFELFDESVLRRANEISFGRAQLPTFDLARSQYVISFGADFLGTWNSPVAQSVNYGEMRQGRPGMRGKFVQVEARMSQTGANADEWLPARPGSEGILAMGFAHVLIHEKLRPAADAGPAGALIAGWQEGLGEFSPPDVERRTGVRADTIVRLAREMAAHPPAVAMIGGAPLAQPGALFGALAVNALNALLGSIEKPGGVFFTPRPPMPEAGPSPTMPGAPGAHSGFRSLVEQIVLSRPFAPQVIFLYDANPVFGTPAEWRARDAFAKVPYLASFGSFLDETSVYADLILPDHSPLESWLDDIPESGTTLAVASLAPPAMRPLHNTRAMPDVLLDVAHQLGGKLSEQLPWKIYEEMLKSAFGPLRPEKGSVTSNDPEDFWNKVQEAGGWWSGEVAPRTARPPAQPTALYRPAENPLAESDAEFPFYFQPFASQFFYDGSLAHLPWMQEAPDPMSSAMWGTWVEIHPKTAGTLNIEQGDLVEVASRHGRLQAPAYISPAIAPNVVAMPVGQGHDNFTRYASGRGASPISILSPDAEPETGALAWAATRVKLARAGEGKLILFGGGVREAQSSNQRR